MRKIILLVLLVFPIISNAQKIRIDRLDDGRRHIICSTKEEELNGAKYEFSIATSEKDDMVDWFLLVSSFYYIPEKVTLLFKLGNDEVITLYLNYRRIGKIDMLTYSSYPRQADYYTTMFELDIDMLKKIEKHGIIKVRISSSGSYNEKSWKKDKLGKFLVKSWRKIEDKYKTTEVKSIYTDF